MDILDPPLYQKSNQNLFWELFLNFGFKDANTKHRVRVGEKRYIHVVNHSSPMLLSISVASPKCTTV